MLTVITGPPCSGKTTYLNQHARPGDVRIDYDDLAQALGSPVRHLHDIAHRRITMMARAAAITESIHWAMHGTPVWVIDTSPTTFRLRQYARACAEFVRLTAPAEELHRRADAGRPPLWHELIDKWITENGHDA